MIRSHTLKNGVRVVMERMDSFRSVAMGVWIAAGSVYETKKEAGASHFIEHMLFKGTETRSAEEIASMMDALGGNLNAFTAKECTCFYAKVLDENVETMADLLADLVQNAKLDPEDIEREKGVVCEEILMTEDSPEDLVHELLAQICYENSPLADPILGTEQSVRALDRAGLVAYMDRLYGSDNMVIAVAGHFEEEAMLALLEEKFQSAFAKPKEPTPESIFRSDRGFIAREKDVEQVHMALGLPGFPLNTEEHYALLVLNNILGGSMSSRLFQEIREKRGLAYSVYSYPSAYAKTGYFSLYAGTGAKQAEQVTELMLAELSRLRAEGVTEEEFLRAKNQLKGSFLLGQESTSARSNSIGKAAILKGFVHADEAERTLKRIEAVNRDSLFAIIPKLIVPERLSAAFVGKLGKQAKNIEKRLKDWA